MSIYAVNGKEPIAAWIPSLDTAGNGTTTLTDLVGSNNGTLTNMDAATDWVADTEAGGVRALDFDGTNDYVTAGGVVGATQSFSFWVKGIAQTDSRVIANGNTGSAATVYAMGSGLTGSTSKLRVFIRTDANGIIKDTNTVATVFDDAWHHVVWIDDSGTAAVYVDGVADSADFDYTPGTLTLNVTSIAALVRSTVGFYFNGRMDDIRIFDQALAAADVTALYAAGNGRGITFGGTIQTRRRRQLVGYGL